MIRTDLMMSLLDQVDDLVLRENIKARYYQDVEAQSNAAQASYFEIALKLEEKIDGLADTATLMLSDSLRKHNEDQVRSMEVLHSEVRFGFQEVNSRFVTIDTKFEEIGTSFADFREVIDGNITELRRRIEDLREESRKRSEIIFKTVNDNVISLSEELANVKRELDSRKVYFDRIKENSDIIKKLSRDLDAITKDFAHIKEELLVDVVSKEERKVLTNHLRSHIKDVPTLKTSVAELKNAVEVMEHKLERLEIMITDLTISLSEGRHN